MALSEPDDVLTTDYLTANLWNTLKGTLFDAMGSQEFTEQNYVTNDETVTASLDALDQEAKDRADNQDNITLVLINGALVRPKFRWKDPDEIYIGPGAYELDGATRKGVYWDAELTFKFGSAGSNSGSDDLAADDWFYVYLDDSAISASQITTADKFIALTTEPAWSAAKHGWYNGNDRCIFAVRTDGSNNILEFYHDGDLVVFADQIATNIINGDLDTTWTDCTFTAPKFTTKVQALFVLNYADVSGSQLWRTNGQTASAGHITNGVTAESTVAYNTLAVITDGSQIIEVKHSGTGANQSDVYTDGWYFPIGL